MTDETKIALKNYDCLVRDRGLNDVAIDWDTETLAYGGGGGNLDLLLQRGFTPATR